MMKLTLQRDHGNTFVVEIDCTYEFTIAVEPDLQRAVFMMLSNERIEHIQSEGIDFTFFTDGCRVKAKAVLRNHQASKKKVEAQVVAKVLRAFDAAFQKLFDELTSAARLFVRIEPLIHDCVRSEASKITHSILREVKVG